MAYFDSFATLPETISIPSLIHTFVDCDAISDIRTDNLIEAVRQSHARDVSFSNSGINVNFMAKLIKMKLRAPQLVTSERDLIQSSPLNVYTTHTGPYPIKTKRLITVVPPITQDSGCVIVTVDGDEGVMAVYVPEVMDHLEFSNDINQLIQAMFQIKYKLATIKGEGKEDLKTNMLMAVVRENLTDNQIWKRLIKSTQIKMTGVYNEEEATVKEIYKIISTYWLPELEKHASTATLYDEDPITTLLIAADQFRALNVEGMTNETAKEQIDEAAAKGKLIMDKFKLICNQNREFEPTIVGKIEETSSVLVQPGASMIISLTNP